MAPQAAALADARAVARRAGRAADEPRAPRPATTAPSALADLHQALPAEVADRLAGLMAGDPALATAVSARLPDARRQSATDLAAYGMPHDGGHTIDISG